MIGLSFMRFPLIFIQSKIDPICCRFLYFH
uniref:Uncharacterized protein n=1 Tax=Siphoviridae sp. ctm7X10 TaxID=2827929 RepID=A0A8S5S4Z5_9CAUD|nr:MAG TPA: hypothetical protein [Siphoviridae sp. ctm7X10]